MDYNFFFLLTAASIKSSYRYPHEFQRDYIYPHLPELVENAHFYISDDEALQQLYFNLAFVYINFYFECTQEQKESFEKKIDPVIFHIFKRYIKRVYEQLLLSLLITAQKEWYCSFASRSYHLFGCCPVTSDLNMEDLDSYRLHCRYIRDLYNVFHETYKIYCDEVGEKPMVEVPNGIYQVIHRVCSLYNEETKTMLHRCDPRLYSYLEKEYSYKQGMPFPEDLSFPNDQLTAFFNEKGPINLKKFWCPRDRNDFGRHFKRIILI